MDYFKTQNNKYIKISGNGKIITADPYGSIYGALKVNNNNNKILTKWIFKIHCLPYSEHCICIGIGSSNNCDGQVLVIDDLIGLSQTNYKFVKKFANVSRIINSAVLKYKSEVLLKRFPGSKHSFKS